MKQGNLTDVRYIKHLLRRAGIAPKRSAGQNFLICEEVVEATTAALDKETTRVTELGAGVGTLTGALAESGFAVRAIEREAALAKILREQLPKKLRGRVEIITKDLRDVDWTKPEPYQLVGNIPYNLSGFIIRRITELSPAPQQVVLLVQKEVSERICAQPPQMSLMSLAVQLWGKAQIILHVPATCFWPQPQVNSSLVLLTPEVTIAQVERETILDLARSCFQAKRKQLSGVLRRKYNLDVPLQARPQELSLQEWQALAKRVYL